MILLKTPLLFESLPIKESRVNNIIIDDPHHLWKIICNISSIQTSNSEQCFDLIDTNTNESLLKKTSVIFEYLNNDLNIRKIKNEVYKTLQKEVEDADANVNRNVGHPAN